MEVLWCLHWFEREFNFDILLVILFQAARYTSEFDKRVFAVALTDSPMKAYIKPFSANVLRMLQKVFILKNLFEQKKISFQRTINWIADSTNTKKVDTPLFMREYGQIRSAGQYRTKEVFEIFIRQFLFYLIGHALHEWTSYTAFHSIFKFFEEERDKLKRSKH